MIPVLSVNGRDYRGWTRFSFTRGMDAAACGFDMDLSQHFVAGADSAGSPVNWAIAPGDRCVLRLADDGADKGDIILDGWVDARQRSVDAAAHSLSVSGRDIVGDLIDCSAVVSPEMWRGQKLETIAQILAAPFGVRVVAEIDTGAPFPVFKLQPGESVFEAIERMCRQRAILALSDAAGQLALTRASKADSADALIYGVNILKAAVAESDEDRFASYTVKTQQMSVDGWTEAAHVVASATDLGVARYRPLLMLAESGGGRAHAKARVEWEAAIRAGRSRTVTVTVQGWRQSNGDFWPVNRLARIVIPIWDIDGVMLIREAVFSLSATDGTTTVLTLAHPDSFLPEPIIKPLGLPTNTREIKSMEEVERL